MADHLSYFIADSVLVGGVNGMHFQEEAVSGGQAGRNRAQEKDTPRREALPPTDASLANNVWRTDKVGNERKRVLGGPIPCGEYKVTAQPLAWVKATEHAKGHYGDYRLDLAPVGPIQITRTGLQIHGRGWQGSYGCIVVLNYAKLILLYNAVKSSKEVTLHVVGGEVQDAG